MWTDVHQRAMQIGIAELFEIVTDLGQLRERGETFFDVVVMPRDMLADERGNELLLVTGQGTALAENLVERPRFIGQVNADSRDQLLARDEIVLQRQEAVEEIAVDLAGGHGRRGGGSWVCGKITVKVSFAVRKDKSRW